MNNKIYVICSRHDENLLSLYQEASYLGYELIPFYANLLDKNFDIFYSTVTEDDYVIVLHINFGSENLNKIVKHTKCKYFLNCKPFSNPSIGNKIYQQNQIEKIDSSLTIETFTKNNILSLKDSLFIAKPSAGSCGNGIFLLNDKSVCANIPEHYIYQRYIKNDGDWRVIVIGGKAVSAIKRLGKIGQPTNNIATGSFAIKENDPIILEKIYPIAEIAAQSMEFDYVGIDIIKDLETNKYYFLESNERPTFETSQILTGINISKKIILETVKER